MQLIRKTIYDHGEKTYFWPWAMCSLWRDPPRWTRNIGTYRSPHDACNWKKYEIHIFFAINLTILYSYDTIHCILYSIQCMYSIITINMYNVYSTYMYIPQLKKKVTVLLICVACTECPAIFQGYDCFFPVTSVF